MKQIIYIFLIAALASSCKKDMMGYEGEEAVYFAVQYENAVINSKVFRSATNIEFARQPAGVQDLQARIKVAITGAVKDHDRAFQVAIDTDSTTAVAGTHYVAFGETFVIPADSIVGYIPITFRRTADMATANKKIRIRLVANENFELAFTKWVAIPELGTTSLGVDSAFDNSIHTINVNDLMVQPAVWPGSIAVGNKETGLWGAFTRKKIELMFDLFDLEYLDFSSTNTMPFVLQTMISQELARYLKNMFNAGTPVLEDDGRLMWCGDVPWTSIIGVPYQ
jgi:hypothetical protein